MAKCNWMPFPIHPSTKFPSPFLASNWPKPTEFGVSLRLAPFLRALPFALEMLLTGPKGAQLPEEKANGGEQKQVEGEEEGEGGGGGGEDEREEVQRGRQIMISDQGVEERAMG